MILFHDGTPYRVRATIAWCGMRGESGIFSDSRDIDAGYCLDAVEDSPAGATARIEPDAAAPFAAPLHALRPV